MALNITLDGFCSRDSGSLTNADVQYQGFFYKVNSGSSASTWNTVRTVEASGYWNINLGDGDWLTQDGSAAAGDRVLIVFWRTGSNRNADCVSMDEWGAFEITLDGSSTYTNPTQVKVNIVPDLHWTFPTVGGTHYVDTSYGANNTSDDVHSWDWSGTTMYHWYLRYGQIINYVNRVNNSAYDWDDLTTSSGLETYDGTHQWDLPGVYNVDLVIEDECGATVTGTKPIQIYWRPPTADITMTPAVPDPNEPVSFQWTGTDIDDTITSIEWIIYDSGAYGNTDTTTSGASDDTIPHSDGTGTDWYGEAPASGAFTNPGTHNVAIVIHWFDGFDAQILNYNENFIQDRFTGPTVNFSQDPNPSPFDENIEFTNTSTDTSRVGTDIPNGDKYDWYWTDKDGLVTSYLDKEYSYKLTQSSDDVGCQVKLCANWNDGWDNQQTCVSGNVSFETTVTISETECYYNLNVRGTSSDGTYTGYSWTVASGAGSIGPWVDVWTTPTGINQQDKTICFTNIGWYKATGYVYGTGTTTNDYEIFYINEICPVTYSGTMAVCEPDMHGYEFGKLDRTGHEIKPTMRAKVDVIPSARIVRTYPLPKNL